MKRKNILLVITTSVLLLLGCSNSVTDNSINPSDLTTSEKSYEEAVSIGQVSNGQIIIADNKGNMLSFNAWAATMAVFSVYNLAKATRLYVSINVC